MFEEEAAGYRWEGSYEKTWEALREDDTGSLETSVLDLIHQAKRKRLADRKKNVRLGIMRHLYIILDMSNAMNDKDMMPTRQACALKLLLGFLDEYFDQNPISQLGFITTKDKRAEKISELSGNSKKHKDALEALMDANSVGEQSVQNALELALQMLKHTPSHSSREIVYIMGSLSSCDPGNISATVELLKRNNVRCSIIGLSAEMHLCRSLARETNGTYKVCLDESHFKELLSEHALPPPSLKNVDSNLIKMGFPEHKRCVDQPSLCACHADADTTDAGTLTASGYFCPQCNSKYCTVPVECRVCGLTLVSAPHLARSYHHLFPLHGFNEQELTAADKNLTCHACFQRITHKAYACPSCSKKYCIDCDLFIHETLHTCPGCQF